METLFLLPPLTIQIAQGALAAVVAFAAASVGIEAITRIISIRKRDALLLPLAEENQAKRLELLHLLINKTAAYQGSPKDRIETLRGLLDANDLGLSDDERKGILSKLSDLESLIDEAAAKIEAVETAKKLPVIDPASHRVKEEISLDFLATQEQWFNNIFDGPEGHAKGDTDGQQPAS